MVKSSPRSSTQAKGKKALCPPLSVWQSRKEERSFVCVEVSSQKRTACWALRKWQGSLRKRSSFNALRESAHRANPIQTPYTWSTTPPTSTPTNRETASESKPTKKPSPFKRRPSQRSNKRPLEQRKGVTVKGSYSPATRVIQLVKGKADFSTGLHEVAHDFYDFAHKHPEYESAINAAYGHLPYRQAQEAFARHYEAYLRSGKSPVKTLQPLFEAARQWMAKIYRQWRHGETPTEVHAMFDKIYANPSQETMRLIREFESFTPPPKSPFARPRIPYSNREDERKAAPKEHSHRLAAITALRPAT